jgi:hypothetical protein
MHNELEKLPRLIERAIAALEKATTAAEILEAKEQASVAYDAAKRAARLKKVKDAHEDILAACRKTQADALVIEARAQIRLADEYDAAQERGEVQKAGGDRKTIIPKKNNDPTVIDIGLTSKQVHEARQIRDAEKAKPGVIRKMLDDQLKAGEEPTKAAIRRAVGRKRKSKPKQTDNLETKIIALSNSGLTSPQIASELGIQGRAVRHALEREQIRLDAAQNAAVLVDDLSMTAQQKLATVIRQHKNQLDIEFEQRVRDEVKRRIDEIVLPHWKEKIDKAQELYARRKGSMDKETFNMIRRALHPDSRQSISDKKLGEAFDAFMALEKYLLNEKDSPTEFPDLPKTWADWERAKQKATAERRAARRAGRVAAVVPR